MNIPQKRKNKELQDEYNPNITLQLMMMKEMNLIFHVFNLTQKGVQLEYKRERKENK